MTRPFIGCSLCCYLLRAGRGPIPRVPRATLSVQTPRGVRQLCDMHASDFVVSVDATSSRRPDGGAQVSRTRVPR